MNNTTPPANVAVYLERQIQNATPAQMVVMLYDGAIKFYTKARYCMEQNDIEGRYNNAARAGDIVAHLLDTLNFDKGGEVAQRLAKIYAYILKRHMDIDMKNDVTAVDDILGHLRTLRGAWEGVAKGGGESSGSEGDAGKSEVAAVKSAIA